MPTKTKRNEPTTTNLSDIQYLIDGAIELNINYHILSANHAKEYLDIIYKKYKFFGAHPQIDGANTIPFEENEINFSLHMKNAPAYIFTPQNPDCLFDQNVILVIDNAQDIARLLYNSLGGVEIYASDQKMTYAIAVNWYSINYIGNIDLDIK